MKTVSGKKVIPITEAEGRIIKVVYTTDPNCENLSGYLYDSYMYRGELQGRIVDINSGYPRYITLAKGTQVIIERNLEDLSESQKARILNIIPLTGVTIGTDPEIFVVDKKTKEIIPAFAFLPSKANKKAGPFWDGFQAEWTTPLDEGTGNGCLNYCADDVHQGLSMVLEKALQYNKNAILTWKNVLEIPPKIMQLAKPEHRQLGCAPSRNVYGTAPLCVADPDTLPIRFAGCHIHVGSEHLKAFSNSRKADVIRSIDRILGVSSVLLLDRMEDPRRRRYYGRAGEYRVPRWGLEYRTMSSAILAHPVLFHLCFELARSATMLACNLPLSIYYDEEDKRIATTINDLDVDEAKKLFKKHVKIYDYILSKRFGVERGRMVKNIILKGAINHMDLNDMDEVWHISEDDWHNDCQTTNCSISRSTTNFLKSGNAEYDDDDEWEDD